MRKTLDAATTSPIAGAALQLNLALLASPLVIVLAVSLTLLMVLIPSAALLASVVPLLLILTSKIHRPLLAACLIGNLLMVFGGTGEVEFLGRLLIRPTSVMSAIVFSNMMAVTIYLVSRTNSQRKPQRETLVLTSKFHAVLLGAAVLLLLLRFTSGVPILQGDSGRLSGLLTINPYFGLLSGVLPIAAAFLKSEKTKFLLVLKLILLVLVIGTASRLLLGAVIVGFVSSSGILNGRLSGKARLYLSIAGVVTVFAVTRIYSARTAEGIQQIYESRLNSIGGVTGWISDLIGPSIFYAARNGLVIHEMLQDGSLRPPHGFITGGLLHVINLNVNPEVWLTSAIGFNVTTVGAIATPVWAGAHADFGIPGTYVFAMLVGLVFALVLQRVPDLEYWFAFGILLSFYGSYMVSSQFLCASIIVAFIVFLNKRKTNVEQRRIGIRHHSGIRSL